MEINDLVAVRIKKGLNNNRCLEPGIILTKFSSSSRLMFDVLVQGKIIQVSTIDLGPVDLITERKVLAEK